MCAVNVRPGGGQWLKVDKINKKLSSSREGRGVTIYYTYRKFLKKSNQRHIK